MPFPFNTPYVKKPELPNADVSDTSIGHIQLEPGSITPEQIAELMRGSEVYTDPVE